MSKIEELIDKLCPDGVKYRRIEDVAIIKRGDRITKRDLKEEGSYKVISGGAEPMGYYDKYNRDEKTITISSYGYAGYVSFIEEKFWANDVCLCVFPNDIVNNKYLYYSLKNMQEYFFSKTTKAIPDHIPTEIIKETCIPVPPLEVQCEIVHILDNFTLLSTLLSAELLAELEARQKQCEYYMDKIFNNATQTKMVKLSDVLVSLKTGLNPRKFFQLNTPDANGYYVTVRELGDRNVRYWESKDRINQIGLNRINERSNLEINDVLFSGTGTIGRVSIIEEKPEDWNVKEGVYILKPKIDLINPVFLMYLMKSNYMRNIYSNYIVGSPVSSIPMKDLKNVEFDLPSIEEQEKIVRILDRFDKLCSDISEGLPTEMEARQKQYEYYKDKLLTFKELKVNE